MAGDPEALENRISSIPRGVSELSSVWLVLFRFLEGFRFMEHDDDDDYDDDGGGGGDQEGTTAMERQKARGRKPKSNIIKTRSRARSNN